MLKFLSPLHKAERQISVWFEERLAGMGISSPEGHLLSYLSGYAPSPIAELVRVFGFRHSTMTSLLDRLETRGLVARSVNPEDRRSFVVRLTRKGKSAARKVRKLVDEIEREIDSRASDLDLEGFRGVMKAVEEATRVRLR